MKWAFVALCLVVNAARAEMDGDDYRAPGTLDDPVERQRVLAVIEAERHAAALREAERRRGPGTNSNASLACRPVAPTPSA